MKEENSWKQNITGDNSLLGPRSDEWWTGTNPSVCPGMENDGIIYSLPLPCLHNSTRQKILDYFDNTWTLTEVLFSSLQGEEAFYRSPYHHLRHPLIFYYGHVATFYINKFRVAGLIQDPINPYFEQHFELGVDEMTWDDMSKNEKTWPSVKEMTDYRKIVYNLVRELILTHPSLDNFSITQEDPAWVFFMCFEHERIHLETSSVLVRELPIHLVLKPKAWPKIYPIQFKSEHPIPGKDYPENKFIEVPEGVVLLGKPKNWPSYGWDNEYGSYQHNVSSFKSTQYLISNGEFLEFVKDYGYHKYQYWSEDGWKWRTFRNAQWPVFWFAEGPSGLHHYKLRTCFELIDMPWSWPVNVNYYEAKAYCAWKKEKENKKGVYRILTEMEHNRIRDHTNSNESRDVRIDPVMVQGGHEVKQLSSMNINLAYGSENSVNAFFPTSMGFYDVFGNVWEWCEDHISALPGFNIHPYYRDFSTPCMDGKHQIIMGGSFASTGDEASIWARFHFRPHFFQHAGFRMVYVEKEDEVLETTCMDSPPPHVGNGPCCTSKKLFNNEKCADNEAGLSLNDHLLFHYGTCEEAETADLSQKNILNFPERCAEFLIDKARVFNIPAERALDLGCSVGRSSFELTRFFKEVLGVDCRSSFIRVANHLKKQGFLDYLRKEEDIDMCLTATISNEICREKVSFITADICQSPNSLGTFDVILLPDLFCHLQNPSTCLEKIGKIVNPGGLLLIVSSYSWVKSSAPKTTELEKYEINQEKIRFSADSNTTLNVDFECIKVEDWPFLIREHSRRFQYIIAQSTLWRRRC